ncbi:MAG TPA: hypothetical protein VGY54_02745 [Polyangiaceae bacterium]|nr:hypothetical protein [Polyangiaceae bacterium]
MNVHEAKTDLSRLLEEVEGGEQVVICLRPAIDSSGLALERDRSVIERFWSMREEQMGIRDDAIDVSGCLRVLIGLRSVLIGVRDEPK